MVEAMQALSLHFFEHFIPMSFGAQFHPLVSQRPSTTTGPTMSLWPNMDLQTASASPNS